MLPAPQQAILSFNMENAYTALYATEAEKAQIASRLQHTTDEDEDEEDEDDEEVEEESDDEEFESSEDQIFDELSKLIMCYSLRFSNN